MPPQRKPIEESRNEIESFIGSNEKWAIEGCYTDLLELAEEYSNEIIFMDLPVDACVSNAKARPWEPHKYETKQAQDANLAMLIDWIKQYTGREDMPSETAHREFYNNYCGKKKRFTRNENHL